MGEVSEVRKTFEDSLRKIDELIEGMRVERDRIKAEFERRLDMVRFGQVDWSRFEEFFEEPYVIVPKRPNEWYVIAPKWLNFQIGWLERSTKSYNIFVVNQYVRLFSSIPSGLNEKFRFKESLPVKVYDGMLLTGKELQSEAWERYNRFLSRRCICF